MSRWRIVWIVVIMLVACSCSRKKAEQPEITEEFEVSVMPPSGCMVAVEEVEIDTIAGGHLAPTDDLSVYRCREIKKYMAQWILLSRTDPTPLHARDNSNGIDIVYIQEGANTKFFKPISIAYPKLIRVEATYQSVDKNNRTYVLEYECGTIERHVVPDGVRTNWHVDIASTNDDRLLYSVSSDEPAFGKDWFLAWCNDDNSVVLTNSTGDKWMVPFDANAESKRVGGSDSLR